MIADLHKTTRLALQRKNILWVLGILAFPFYLFPKGGVQISSVLLIIAAMQSIRWSPGALLSPGDRAIARVLFPLFFFVCYVTLIQLTWSAILGTSSMLIFAAYYIFNLFIFFGVARRCIESREYAPLIVRITLLSVVLQASLSILGLGNIEGTRAVVFFQNPNQLGYFSILSAGILTVGVRKSFLTPTAFMVGLICCLWLAQLSLSKAAMVAIVVLLGYGGLRSLKSVAWSVAAVALVIGAGVPDDRIDLIDARFESVGTQRDDSLAGRGYDRMWLHPEMNLIGAGEGGNWRWEGFLDTGEIHSSWATILFSYGIPGMIGMCIFLWRLSPLLGLASLVPMMAIFLYGLTHMGLRFVPMWILFGLITGISAYEKRVKRQRFTGQPEVKMRRHATALFR